MLVLPLLTCSLGAEPIEVGVPACRALIEAMKTRFLASGGTILEDTAFRSAEVYPEGVAIRCSPVRVLLVSGSRVCMLRTEGAVADPRRLRLLHCRLAGGMMQAILLSTAHSGSVCEAQVHTRSHLWKAAMRKLTYACIAACACPATEALLT